MKLEDQVCTLEQAKRLKSMGVEQDSICQWNLLPGISPTPALFYSVQPVNEHSFAAFTVAELGVMLGCNYHSMQGPDKYWLTCIWHEDTWVNVGSLYRSFPNRYFTEAEARAALLIFLIKKAETPDEVNQRLNA